MRREHRVLARREPDRRLPARARCASRDGAALGDRMGGRVLRRARSARRRAASSSTATRSLGAARDGGVLPGRGPADLPVPARARACRGRIADARPSAAAFAELRRTFAGRRSFPDLFRLLWVLFLEQAGVAVVIGFAAVYAQGEFSLNGNDTILLFIGLQLAAAAGRRALRVRSGQDRRKARADRDDPHMAPRRRAHAPLARACRSSASGPRIAGIAMGSSQASGRAMVGTFTPPDRQGEWFGLWGISMKAAGVAGLVIYALVRECGLDAHRHVVDRGFLRPEPRRARDLDEKRGMSAAAAGRSDADMEPLSGPASSYRHPDYLDEAAHANIERPEDADARPLRHRRRAGADPDRRHDPAGARVLGGGSRRRSSPTRSSIITGARRWRGRSSTRSAPRRCPPRASSSATAATSSGRSSAGSCCARGRCSARAPSIPSSRVTSRPREGGSATIHDALGGFPAKEVIEALARDRDIVAIYADLPSNATGGWPARDRVLEVVDGRAEEATSS